MEIIEKIRKMLQKEVQKTGKINLILYKNIDYLKPEEKVINNLLLTTLFIDTYKMLHYKQITNTLSEEELKVVPLLERIVDFDDINKVITENELFAKIAVNSVLAFKNATAMQKYATVKTLTEEDKNFLLEIVPLIAEDIEKYDKELELEDYYKYYNNLANYYKKKGIKINPEVIIRQLQGFVRLIYPYKTEEIKALVEKLSMIDNIEVTSDMKNLKNIANGIRKAEKRKKIYETLTEEEKTMLALTDEYYLSELFESFINYRSKFETKEEFEKTINLKKKVKE